MASMRQIESVYLRAGFSKTQVIAKIHLETGVSMSSIRASIAGYRVQLRTAMRLEKWALEIHRKRLDLIEMISAQTKGSGK